MSEKKHSNNAKKPITLNGQTFASYTEAAIALNKSLSAISKYAKKHGSLDLKDGPTKELLSNGKLGKVYLTTKEAKQDLNITCPWSVFVNRMLHDVPIEIARDTKVYNDYLKDKKAKDIHVFKEPVMIDGISYKTYGDLKRTFEPKLGSIASTQTIRKRRTKGITGIDLIKDKTHQIKRRVNK